MRHVYFVGPGGEVIKARLVYDYGESYFMDTD